MIILVWMRNDADLKNISGWWHAYDYSGVDEE